MTTQTYPDQLMLPGQTAAPGGPVDMMMMYVMHHAFRRDLNRFTAAVAATPVEDVETWQGLEQRWSLFFEILHLHHSGEDAGIWPFLLERADEDEKATLLAMEDEHGHIDPLLTSCAEGFSTLAGDRIALRERHGDAEDVRAALQVRMAATRDALARHLAHEETEAMVILQRHMTPEDWERIEEEHFQKKLGLGKTIKMVCWVVEDMPHDKRDDVFATVGGPFKLLWKLGRRSFRRTERRTFRHAGVR